MYKFEDFIGYEQIKEELIKITSMMKSPEKYTQLGVEIPRAILLYDTPEDLGKIML